MRWLNFWGERACRPTCTNSISTLCDQASTLNFNTEIPSLLTLKDGANIRTEYMYMYTWITVSRGSFFVLHTDVWITWITVQAHRWECTSYVGTNSLILNPSVPHKTSSLPHTRVINHASLPHKPSCGVLWYAGNHTYHRKSHAWYTVV